MKKSDIVGIKPGLRPDWLGQPGSWIKEWEDVHLSAPALRQEYEAIRRAFNVIIKVLRKNSEKAGVETDEGQTAESSGQWWDSYIPAYVWLMYHEGGEEEFKSLTDAVIGEVQERFLPRVYMYAVMLQDARVIEQLDGKTAYHVKRINKTMTERNKKKGKK